MFDVSRAEALRDSKQHPTQKSLTVMKKAIAYTDLSGERQDTIVDPFMESGTILRAANDLNRKAIGIEDDEKYCEIAASRMMQEVLAM